MTSKNKNNKTEALPRYFIPRDLERAIKDNDEWPVNPRNKFSQVLQKLKNIDCLEIAECHYRQFLKLGLYLEEYQQREDTRKQFQIEGTTIEKIPDSEEKFMIKVDNLDETDPFLNVSDFLIAYEQKKRKPIFFLTIVKVSKDHVVVSPTKLFCKMYRELAKYNVELKFNTYTFQCGHYALAAVNSVMLSNYIFPKKPHAISSREYTYQRWFNIDVLNNPDQKQAVFNIINKSSFPAPYILYGPPGTGKTSTLVEAVCQSWNQTNDYILICAPSNSACDVITKRLLDYIPSNNLHRMYSRTEDYSQIDNDIKKCCNFKDNGEVIEIEKVDLSHRKIIITTLCTSLRLENKKLPFSHLFIDEGGQTTLTDVLLPFCAFKFSQSFQIVICGDHHQLGPSMRSKLAEPLLGQSILEKLMKRDLYKKDERTGYDQRYITKLLRNFRSSKDIIHVPNVLFYDNELIACKEMKIDTFPVAFYPVQGNEEKALNSPSSYNEDEVNQVLFIAKSFIGKKVGDKVIRSEDIGIVTPFKLQVSKIREKLNKNRLLKNIDVGTVEIFQGQEREIIIISTVRTKTFFHNGHKHIGFLSNPKRFNVALTRAKSLLMVVGNPVVLRTNKYWHYFLQFCQENNACKGNLSLLNDEVSSCFQDSTFGIKIKKSTELFNATFTILNIDDGRTPTLNTNVVDDENSKAFSNTKALTTNTESVSVNTGGTVGNILKKPINNIHQLSNWEVSSDSLTIYNSSLRNLDSIRSSSVTSYGMNRINSMLPNSRTSCTRTAARTDDIWQPRGNIASVKKSIDKVNQLTKLEIPSSSINSSMRTLDSTPSSSIVYEANRINSVQNLPLNTDALHSTRSIANSTNSRICNISNSYENYSRKPINQNENVCFNCCILL